MKDTVIVFARAPRLGVVKRRLARDLGDRAALRFHAGTLHRLLRALARDRRYRTVLALTPDHAYYRLPHGVARITQDRGDLGWRMHAACRRYRRGNVAIIGCDIPDAGPADVAAGFRALGCADAVFGPACDGGFWLVALGPRRPDRPFAGARWSTAHALADTLRNFTTHRVAMARMLQDVDTATDLNSVRTA